MRNTWEFFSTQQIVFGNGAVHRLPAIIAKFKAKRIFLITDPGIKHAGIADRILSILKSRDLEVAVYDQAIPEPPVQTALDCYEFAKSRMDTDLIIGLGGGSSIDLAKVTALLMAYGGHPTEYFGENKVPGPIAPLIAIPTTAGTGSEVTSVSVLADTANNLKVGISDNYLRPAVALLDPELTVGLPPYVTACSGIDALAHAVEAYTAKSYPYIQAEGDILFQGALPISDALALEAIELVAKNLTLAVQQGSNLEARKNMLLASLLAGMAFSNAGTALAHALAYPIGGLCKSPHGELTGLLLPYVMEYNAAVETEKMIKIARAFDVQLNGLDRHDAALSASQAVLRLVEEIGLPTRISQIGIQEAAIPEIAEKTLGISRLVRNNPRVPTQKGLEELLRRAF
ncbi:iron-containing alcohol dehydrogenase [Fodinisporobacter ferrooxydans]|uniref:hydroxyacid-oxoacid transhydrogenase n=1 Tax=Fodinisporobacter ferrooxydans TaxID=2901836 RepID=A0ABY4CIG0_9BACL|nr:iron-containing alcohol dehydrogenase [Alicyclobacillaceae bacterium MYW30-H2]